MPLFPLLDTEAMVQEGDKTRLDGFKSFAAGVSDIIAMTIAPGTAATAIDVTEERFLDWLFDFTFEIDTSNQSIDFSEGNVAKLATVPVGAYTPTALAAAIQAAMRTAGTQAYVVTLSAKNELQISAPAAFGVLPVSGSHLSTSLLVQMGFGPLLPSQSPLVSGEAGSDWLGKATYKGYPIETVLKKITLSVTNEDDTPLTATIVKYITVVSKLADRLFSTDDDLRKHESDILKYIPEGRATYLDIHRRAQTLILNWLDRNGYIDDLGYKFTLHRCLSIEEFKEWSTHLVLKLIFEGLVVSADDIFSKKAERYEDRETFWQGRSILRIDMNQDGRIDVSETLDTGSCVVVRR